MQVVSTKEFVFVSPLGTPRSLSISRFLHILTDRNSWLEQSSNPDVRQKCKPLAKGGTGQNDLIQFIGGLHASFRDASDREANVECQTNNGEGNGERNTGSEVPRRLLTSFTLKEAKKVERFRPLNQTLQPLGLGRLIDQSLLLPCFVRRGDGIGSSLL